MKIANETFSVFKCYICSRKYSMRTLINKTVAFMMALVVLISTTGFNIYEHQCTCTDTVATLLFDNETDCCHHEVPSCCAEQKHSCGNEDGGSDKDCCTSSLKYLKINIPFKLPVQEQQQIDLSVSLFAYDVFNGQKAEEQEMNHISTSDPPEALIGIRLILYLHKLKIAPPSA